MLPDRNDRHNAVHMRQWTLEFRVKLCWAMFRYVSRGNQARQKVIQNKGFIKGRVQRSYHQKRERVSAYLNSCTVLISNLVYMRLSHISFSCLRQPYNKSQFYLSSLEWISVSYDLKKLEQDRSNQGSKFFNSKKNTLYFVVSPAALSYKLVQAISLKKFLSLHNLLFLS